MSKKASFKVDDEVNIAAKVVSIEPHGDGLAVTVEIVDADGNGHCVTLNEAQTANAVTKA